MNHVGVEDIGVEHAGAEHRGVEDLGVGMVSGGFGSAGPHDHAGVEKEERARAPHDARVARGGGGGVGWPRWCRVAAVAQAGGGACGHGGSGACGHSGVGRPRWHGWLTVSWREADGGAWKTAFEMGEFLAAAARGLYTQAPSLRGGFGTGSDEK
jgi:hypothetical protein